MVDIEKLRSAIQGALRSGMSADALASEIGDVSGQTVLNFAQPGHRVLGRTRKAFEAWYLKWPGAKKAPEAPIGVVEGRVSVLERSLKEQRDEVKRLRRELEAREQVVELITDALLDAVFSQAVMRDEVERFRAENVVPQEPMDPDVAAAVAASEPTPNEEADVPPVRRKRGTAGG